jgi:hypothetical protein
MVERKRKRDFDQLKSELDCIICTDTIVAPTALPCGHNFCQDCVLRWFEEKRECPTCRACFPKNVVQKLSVNLSLEKVIDQVMLHSKSYKKKKRKQRKTKKWMDYGKNYRHTKRFRELIEFLLEEFDQNEGIIEYDKTVEKLKEKGFHKAELDVYLYYTSVERETDILLLDKYIIHGCACDSLTPTIDGEILKDPKKMLYLALNMSEGMFFADMETFLEPYTKPTFQKEYEHLKSSIDVFKNLYSIRKEFEMNSN